MKILHPMVRYIIDIPTAFRIRRNEIFLGKWNPQLKFSNKEFYSAGIETLVSTLKDMTYLPNRKGEGELVFNVDHCFSIKGQGTVLTGTILQGSVKVNDVSLIPDIFHYTSY